DMNIEYKILSETSADVYAKINMSKLILALDRVNCDVISANERNESLESYYISLVGGDQDA
ncbi:MAG: ABC transporter ATP-binding protein, partial [Lachnospiraceae bacterium]|nr:ABC transporter ATP-binding protein [Lachnospiraceae bacterium]